MYESENTQQAKQYIIAAESGLQPGYPILPKNSWIWLATMNEEDALHAFDQCDKSSRPLFLWKRNPDRDWSKVLS